ncbi:MAG: Hsp70 family protein [Deltaproteobacteria bacterium]|nr:Hsp70 family protein [Deltaproteobacteria bacterium]
MAELTVDLGNYNTILTFRDLGEGASGLLKGVAREVQECPGVLFVPSLIHMGDGPLLGEEVLWSGLYEEEGTFRDLKDHVLHPAPVSRSIRGRRISHKAAAAAFLAHLVERVRAELGQRLDVVLLFPNVGAEAYREWLRSVDFGSAASVTLVDEDTAVALGYGVNLFVDDLVMVFDFGFSSIRARVVQFHWLGREAYAPPVIKAAASLPVGTADLKQKILRELHTDASDEQLPSFYWKKFALHADGETLSDERFQELLERENLAAYVQRVIERAHEEASLGGVKPQDIRRVLLVGGGTRIPLVRRILAENYGERVLGHLPELAAGRGGVAFLADSPVDDMVHQTYSMQVRDPITGEYSYPVVVERFTRYPTRSPTARYIVNTYYEGQYELHLKLFRTVNPGESGQSREILFGEDGKMSFVASRTEEVHEPLGTGPVVIPVHPPGRVGERRFLLEFGVDNQKRLLVTAKDLREEKVLWQEKPLIDLQ